MKLLQATLLAFACLARLCPFSAAAGAAPSLPGVQPNVLGDDFIAARWTTSEGLPENSSTAVAQTGDGYIWFGTFNGLVRFDGVKVTTFNPENTPELPSESIINLHSDSRGRLWVSTSRGLATFSHGKWKNWTRSNQSQSNFARTITDNAGIVCITSYDGRIFREQQDQLTELPEPPGQRGSGYFGHVAPDGMIWAGQAGFFGSWSGKTWVHSPLESTVTNQFRGLGPGRDGSALIVAGSKLLRVANDQVREALTLPGDPADLWEVSEARASSIWLSSQDRGLIHLAPGSETRWYRQSSGLTADSIRCAFEDREGNTWVGNSGHGLLKLTPRRFAVANLPEFGKSLRMPALANDPSGHLVIGSYGGGVGVLRDQQRFDRVPVKKSYVQALAYDSRTNLWIGYYHEPVHIVSPSGEVRVVNPAESGGQDISAIFQDTRNRLWLAGETTICRFEDGEFHRAAAGQEAPLGNVASFAEDPQDHSIWACGGECLLRFDGGRWAEIRGPSGERLAGTISLHFSTDGTLWIGTSSGLLRRRNGEFRTIGRKDGLPVALVGSILDDGLGYFWLGSNRGLVRVRRTDLEKAADGQGEIERTQLFTRSDGLPSDECVSRFQSPSLRDAQGRLWFATAQGLASIDPQTVRLNTNPPHVILEEFAFRSHNGQTTLCDLASGQIVRIPPGEGLISASFTALSYSAPEKLRFFYSVQGLHKDWIDNGNQRVVDFFPPGPGTYRLKIRAINNDGYKSDSEASVQFAILPFPTETAFFRIGGPLILALAVGLAAKALSRRRYRRKLRELELERLVQQERARLGEILTATTDFVALADPNGHLLFVNNAGRRLLGFHSDQLIQESTLSDLYPMAQAERFSRDILPAAQSSGSWSGESTLRQLGGRVIPVSQVVLVHKDRAGDIERISVVARDITEQQRAAAALQKSEEKFALFFRASPLPKIISRLATSQVIDTNRAMEQFSGFAREELLGHTFGELGLWHDPEACHHLAHELQERGLIRRREVVLRTRRHPQAVVELSAEIVELDGDRCVLTVLTDITARKEMEQTLLQLNRRYARNEAALSTLSRTYAVKPGELTAVLHEITEVVARTLETAQVSVWMRNPQGSTLTCLDSFHASTHQHQPALDLARDDHPILFEKIEESSVLAVADAASDPRTLSLARALCSDEQSLSLLVAPLHSHHACGGALICHHLGSPRHWLPDEQTFAVAVANLLSVLFAQQEREQLHEQLRQTQKLEALGTLAGGIAHDFNNILGAITSFAELTRLDRPDDPDLQDNMKQILSASRRAVELVRKILAVGRRQPQQKQVIQLADVMNEVVALIRSTTPVSIQIEAAAEPALPPIFADPTQMHQVIMNLCTNACQAMAGQAGSLKLSLEAVAAWKIEPSAHRRFTPGPHSHATGLLLQLTVTDTGHGIPAEVLRRIFDPFFTTKPIGHGTGLGLSVAHGIVQEHDGVIQVESEPGRGSTFRVLIPACELAADPKSPASDRPAHGHGARLLIVDDEKSIARGAGALLQRYGFTAHIHTCPNEALHLFVDAPGRFDAVLADLNMPGLSGLQLAERILAVRPGLPFFLMSGNPADAPPSDVSRLGVRHLFAKPLNISEVAGQLSTAISQAKKLTPT